MEADKVLLYIVNKYITYSLLQVIIIQCCSRNRTGNRNFHPKRPITAFEISSIGLIEPEILAPKQFKLFKLWQTHHQK